MSSYPENGRPAEYDAWRVCVPVAEGNTTQRIQSDRDAYQLPEILESKAQWLKLPDRKATMQTMRNPEERIPGRETQQVSATEKALQDARKGLQTLMKYQKHTKSTFRPAIYNPPPGQELTPSELHRAEFIAENRRIQDIATQHVNSGSGSTYYPTKNMPKQGQHRSGTPTH